MDTNNNVLNDSGERTVFSSGAVRDMIKGKGRCDLLPGGVCYLYLCAKIDCGMLTMEDVFNEILEFTKTGDPIYFINAVKVFAGVEKRHDGNILLDFAKHMEAGAQKYGERNWEKGIPVERYVDSGIRHFLKYMAGYTDEPHDRAFIWNMLCGAQTAYWYPELNPYPIKLLDDRTAKNDTDKSNEDSEYSYSVLALKKYIAESNACYSGQTVRIDNILGLIL